MISLPTFRGVLSGFNPLSLSPALWLNDTGSDPSVWTDMSGNGRDASQADPAKRPSIVTNALNGKQVRRFDGVNDFLGLTTGLNMFKQVSGATVIMAYKWVSNPNATSNVFFASNGPLATTSRVLVGGGYGTPRKLHSGGRRLDGDVFSAIGSTADNPTTYFVHSGILDYANSDIFQYVNATLDGSSTSFQTNGITDNSDSAITIGSSAGSQSFSNVDIAEILVFPTALSDVNRQKVERYLSGKYAIAF